MSVLQMQRLSICAMKKDRKAVLEELQRLKVMEIDTSVAEDAGLTKMNTTEARQSFEKKASLCEQALDVLDEYVPEKTSMFSALEGKALIGQDVYHKVVGDAYKIMEVSEKLLSCRKKIAESKAAIAKDEAALEALTPWLALDVPMNCQGTKRTAVLIGSIGSVMTLDDLYVKLANQLPELENFDLQIVSADKDQTCLAAVCMKEEEQKLEEALRSCGFSKPPQSFSGLASEEKTRLEEEIKELQKEVRATEEMIAGKAPHRETLRILSDYFRVRAQKYEVLGQVPQTKQTFFVSGYVPAKTAKALAEKLEKNFELSVEIEDLSEEEEAPVLLGNGKISGSMEGVVASFGLPAKGEIDPTKIMSIFYIFLFGLMLSDAAYGLIVFVACAVLLKKYPRMSEGMNKSLRMFMYCGISTLVWGILFGGYFGDAVNVISRTFFGHEVTIDAVWFVPLNDPMKMLIYSMLFGLIHLFVGLGIKGYICLRDKNYLDFFCDVVLWFMMLGGLILMLVPSSLFYSISQMEIHFPAAVNLLAKVLAIAGAVGILFMSGRGRKNPALRLALGAYDLYNITGWLSDVLSYSRLLALGLATGVIASVVNQMGSMLGNSVMGIILFVVVFIFGHTFNIAINLLGAYVHTNRLQYVEFFGKFYEGGGRAFNPFKSDTKYVDVKEETKL